MKQSSISFLLTKEECDLLERIIYLEPWIDEVLDKAIMEAEFVRLKFDYDDLKDCIDALSAEMEQNDSPREELMPLRDKLEGYSKLRQHVGQYGKVRRKKASVSDVCVFDVQMIHYPPKGKKIMRTITVSGKKSLYQFAGAIVKSFGFFFDHCFAFYGDVNKHPVSEQKEIYELFVDIGEEPTAPHAKGVKKIKIEKVFTAVGKTMLFMFDYGDDWRFGVTLKEIRSNVDGEKLPKVLNSIGKAPMQYPPCKE